MQTQNQIDAQNALFESEKWFTESQNNYWENKTIENRIEFDNAWNHMQAQKQNVVDCAFDHIKI